MSEFDNPEIFRFILETIPTGVYLVDRNRRILFWNAGAENICGYLRQDVIGRFLREHLLAEECKIDDVETNPCDPLSLAFRDGKSSTARVSILHKEGYRVPIVLQTVPIRNERGAIIGAAECFQTNTSSSDKTRRRNAAVELQCLDAVTGMPARIFMEQQLREQLTMFAERHIPFGILLLQIDQLDRLRIARGPGVVPSILRIVAQTIENSLRPTDLVGCWSDDRFLALLAGCKESEIDPVATRLCKMVAQSEVEWWGDNFSVTVAIGGAGSRAEDTLEILTERAEKLLGESLAVGGNCVSVVR